MDAYFYNLNKRKNSTKVPSDSGTKFEIKLKDNTDFDNPVFIMNSNVTGYNYAAWNGAYYFIVGRKYITNSIFEITLEIDPMGTHKSEIKSSTQFVLRSSVSPDYTLIDNLYPTGYLPTIYQQSGNQMNLNSTGSYVLITKSSHGVQYFGLTLSDLLNLFDTLMLEKQEDLWAEIVHNAPAVIPSFLNVMDYIIGCRWVPFPVQTGYASQEIYLGYWRTHMSCPEYPPVLQYTDLTEAFTLHLHTGSKLFLNNPQFHRIIIYVPGCGEFPIDVSKCPSGTINVAFKIDSLGNVVGAVASGSGGTFNVIQRFSGALGKDVPISSSTGVAGGIAKIGAGVGSLVAAGIGIATGGMSAVAAAGLAGGGAVSIGSGIQNTIADVSTKGGIDSYALPPWGNQIMCTEIIYDITNQNGTINGYPCMKTLTLSSDGFYQCKDPQVDFGDDLFQKDKIISYMTEGFYIE